LPVPLLLRQPLLCRFPPLRCPTCPLEKAYFDWLERVELEAIARFPLRTTFSASEML
jgi:hypothetical protein